MEEGEVLDRGTFQVDMSTPDAGGLKRGSSSLFSNKLSNPSEGLVREGSGIWVLELREESVETVESVSSDCEGLEDAAEVPSGVSLFSTARTPTISIGTKFGSDVLTGGSEVVKRNILKKFMARLGEA